MHRVCVDDREYILSRSAMVEIKAGRSCGDCSRGRSRQVYLAARRLIRRRLPTSRSPRHPPERQTCQRMPRGLSARLRHDDSTPTFTPRQLNSHDSCPLNTYDW